jgi:superfamily I DNA and RNA helicase
LRSFTGDYDADGTPLYRDGDVLFDSVFRFKGQCAPCVILTEIDFEVLDQNALRRLFVGATRATMKLMLVISERAASELIGRL